LKLVTRPAVRLKNAGAARKKLLEWLYLAATFPPIVDDTVRAVMPLAAEEKRGGRNASREDRPATLALMLNSAFAPVMKHAIMDVWRRPQIVRVRAEHEQKFVCPLGPRLDQGSCGRRCADGAVAPETCRPKPREQLNGSRDKLDAYLLLHKINKKVGKRGHLSQMFRKASIVARQCEMF
jgi:hypothetical protein